jgi:hypothetical protein
VFLESCSKISVCPTYFDMFIMSASERKNPRAVWKRIEEIQLFQEGVVKCIYLVNPFLKSRQV